MFKSNSKEPKLTFALDASDRMVSILNVKSGLACNCRCPQCHQPLIARKGEQRQKHFAHQGEHNAKTTHSCHGYYMTALHKLAEQILQEKKVVMIPPYYEIDAQRLSFVDVEIEMRNDRKDLQPDVVGITADGTRCHIEIRNTSEVKKEKQSKIKESGIICLEIDVRDIPLDNLENFLINSTEQRVWINNPKYDADLQERFKHQIANYKAKHQCDLKRQSDCSFCCQRGLHITCPYQLVRIEHRGESYVLCKKNYVTSSPPPIKPIIKETKPQRPKGIQLSMWPQDYSSTNINENNVKSLDDYYQTLITDKVFSDSYGRTTDIINYGRTKNGNGIVIMHIDKNYLSLSRPIYLTLITSRNGKLQFTPKGHFESEGKAAIAFGTLRGF